MLKLKEVAEELNFTYRGVYEWVKTGKINAVKVNGGWRIPKEEIERLKRGEKN